MRKYRIIRAPTGRWDGGTGGIPPFFLYLSVHVHQVQPKSTFLFSFQNRKEKSSKREKKASPPTRLPPRSSSFSRRGWETPRRTAFFGIINAATSYQCTACNGVLCDRSSSDTSMGHGHDLSRSGSQASRNGSTPGHTILFEPSKPCVYQT